MLRRLLAVSVFCGLGSGLLPAQAAAIPPRPTTITYHFAHGRVVNPRGVHLDMTVSTEDPFTPSNNGNYHVLFDAKMLQYVDTAAGGGAEISAVLTEPMTQVNGVPVLNAVPPTYNSTTKKQNEYLLIVTANGTCNCSSLPPLIYSVAGNVPRHIYLGDLFSYLHPYLPRTAAALRGSWGSSLQLGLTPKQLRTFTLVSKLVFQKDTWNVVSHTSNTFRLSEPLAQWQKDWGVSWQDPLPYGGPVTVSGSFSIDSTLTLAHNDGIDVVPVGAKGPPLKPGQAGKTKSTRCASCNGYTMPLSGVETLHLSYSQAGHELQRVDLRAALTVRVDLNS